MQQSCGWAWKKSIWQSTKVHIQMTGNTFHQASSHSCAANPELQTNDLLEKPLSWYQHVDSSCRYTKPQCLVRQTLDMWKQFQCGESCWDDKASGCNPFATIANTAWLSSKNLKLMLSENANWIKWPRWREPPADWQIHSLGRATYHALSLDTPG